MSLHSTVLQAGRRRSGHPPAALQSACPTFSGTRRSRPTCTMRMAASMHSAIKHCTAPHRPAPHRIALHFWLASVLRAPARLPAATVVPIAACCLHRYQVAYIVGMWHVVWVGTCQSAVRLRHAEPAGWLQQNDPLPLHPLTCSSPSPSHAPQDWRQYPSLLSSPSIYAGLQQGQRCVCSVCCRADAKSCARHSEQASGSVCSSVH